EQGAGSRTGRQQRQEVVRVLTCLGEPATDGGNVLRVGILLPPLPDRAPALDVLRRALEARQQRRRIARQERRNEHRITWQPVQGLLLPAPRSLLPQLRQPNPRRSDVAPTRRPFPVACRRHYPLEPLVPHPLRRELGQPLHVRLGGLEGARVNLEPEAGTEAQRPEDPQV